MQPVKLHCSNGLYMWHPDFTPDMKIRTIRNTYDEDTIHDHLPIPEGTELSIVNCYQNLYGCFIDVKYSDRTYSIKPKHVEVL